jgi:hypothetical protein
MRRFVRRAALASLVLAQASTVVTSAPATAAAFSSQWERIDAPGAAATSEYQAVETSTDGSIYVAGWHRFPALGLGDVYETIVRKFDPSGTVVWTAQVGGLWSTEPDIPDLVVDGPGNPYLKLCRSTCELSAFDKVDGEPLDSISDSGIQNSSPPIGVKSGGVLVVSRLGGAPTTLAARRLGPGLDESWSFDLTGKLDADANTWLVEDSSGAFWAIGHKPGSDGEMRMAHFSGAGGALGDPIEHSGGTPFDEVWAAGRSSPVSRGPADSVWIFVDPPGADLLDQRLEAFSLTSGALLGNVDRNPPQEQIQFQSGYAQCDFEDTDVLFGGLLTGTQLEPRFEQRVLGSLFTTVMRCTPVGGGAPVPIMVVYTTSSPLGGAWVRVGQLPFPPDSTVLDVATDVTGGLVFAGWTSAASSQAWFLLPPGSTSGSTSVPRAALARNPTGSPDADFHSLPPVRLFDTRASEQQGLVQVSKTRIPAGGELKIRVTGFGGVPANGAGSVSLNVTVTNPASSGFITVHPCGTRPLASNLNYVANQTVANAVIAPLSAAGEVCFYSHVATDLLADVNGWFRAGGSFHALTPVRIFDSRPNESDGAIHITKQRYGGAAIIAVRVGDVPGVPATTSAVSLNVTATESLGDGFVTVFPCGDRPLASNLNFTAGQTVPNAVIAPLGNDSVLCFYAHADTHLIADINGYFASSSASFHALSPTRVFDTRVGEADGAVVVTKRKYGGDTVLTAHIAGTAGVPATDVAAVSLNVTVTNPVGPGFVTVYPCGERPLASNVNFTLGQTIPNAVISPVSSDGEVCFYAHADTDLIADVNGWFQS